MRLITLAVALLTAVVVIAILSRVLPPEAAAILLDIKRSTWPLTVQNILWLAFFAGLGELSIRWRAPWDGGCHQLWCVSICSACRSHSRPFARITTT